MLSITFISTLGLIVCVLTFFSKGLGLGHGEQFILYKNLGLPRKTVFVIAFLVATPVVARLSILLVKKLLMLRASWANIDKILSNAFLILTSMILSFLILDYTASFFLETRSPFEQLYPVGKTRTPTPFIMSKGVPGTEFWDGSRNNELGYRGRSAAEADDDDFLVFVLGGSTVFSGAPPISDLLESRIQVAGHTNIKVLNYGVPSSNSGMELARLVYEVANFRPDMIIMYNGGNDLLHPLQWDPRPGYPFNFIAFERNPLLEEFRNYDTLTMMLLGSSIGRYTISRVARSSMNDFLRLPELREEVDWNTDVWREAIVKKYLENMMKAQAIAMAFNSKFYVFFQPLKAYAPPQASRLVTTTTF
ncbi:MAG: hypothetical protein CMM74_07695 [Rhodospirillaceae bacterium]|nr:hypothetical protein [Rhodospirillaceae bacterium]